jgi:hypothetical protein
MDSTSLKCIICPKNPTFSDVSHLLTHISSKGHLAHQFKLKLRSQQEPETQELLASYDDWYNQHDLGKLLSERMQLKDSKKPGTRNRARKSDNLQARSKSRRQSDPRQAKPVPDPENVLDPRLSQSQFGDPNVS